MSDRRFTIVATSNFTTEGGFVRRRGDVLHTTDDEATADLFRGKAAAGFYAVLDSHKTGTAADLTVGVASTPTCSFGECDHDHGAARPDRDSDGYADWRAS